MPKYYLWDDPFSYAVVTFDFYFIFSQVLLRFIKFMKVIYFYWAEMPKIPTFMSKLIKIDIFIIKNLFCNDPSFIFFFRFLAPDQFFNTV